MDDSKQVGQPPSPELVGFQLLHFPLRRKFYCLHCLEQTSFWGNDKRRAIAIVRFPSLQHSERMSPSYFRAVRVGRRSDFLKREYTITDEEAFQVGGDIIKRVVNHGLFLVPSLPVPEPRSRLKCVICKRQLWADPHAAAK